MIRRSESSDIAWIQRVADQVYRDLGDYGLAIASWLGTSGVFAYVDTDQRNTRRGFIVIEFHVPEPSARSPFVADVLAIAVAPEHQRQGIGRALLDHAIRAAVSVGRLYPRREMRLTVADGNDAGLRLYQAAGFEIMDSVHGAYPGGQRAIRMVRALDG